MRSVVFATALVGLACASSTHAQVVRQGTQFTRESHGVFGSTIEPSRRVRIPGFNWDHEIQIALPTGYFDAVNAKRSYPVLWVTDGSWMFDLAVGIANGYVINHVPEMIVIGIGVPLEEENKWFEFRRMYDFLPSAPDSLVGGRLADLGKQRWAEYTRMIADKTGVSAVYGGAAKFLEFAIGDLRRNLAQDYRMMSEENTLLGYSAGGAFCEYALLTRPEGFNRYLCGGGTSAAVIKQEEEYARKHSDLKARVFLGISDGDILHGERPSTVDLYTILASRRYPSLELTTDIFVDEDHSSAIPVFMSRGLRAVWQGSALTRR